VILLWEILLFLGGLTYLYFIGRILRGLNRLRRQPHRSLPDDELPSVSVVIAARDEESFIRRTIQAVQAQDYPPDRLEIIVVDDRSTDGTAAVVETLARADPRIRLLRQTSVPAGSSPKKGALETAVRAAAGDVIAATDADCRPPRGWARKLVSGLSGGAKMAIGQARFDIGAQPPLWQRMQALDFQSIGLCAAGLAADGFAFTGNGASLAFRRDFFQKAGGYAGVRQFISGDDELLLAKAATILGGVVAVTGEDAVVPTRAAESLRELWHQRARWGSKGLHYAWSRKLTLMGIFLFLLALATGPLLILMGAPWSWWLSAASLKVALDLTVFLCGVQLFGEVFTGWVFAVTEIIHAPAMVLFALAGHFSRFEWKGQRFRSRGEARGTA